MKLFIGTETYEASGPNLKAAKQNVALQVLHHDIYCI
jgi:hypothetical protein